MDPRLSDGGILKGAAIGDVLRQLDLPERIEDLDRPFIAVATDLGTGREVWLRDGDLAQAVRASVSIPGVFAPQRDGERFLLDGGLVNPVPGSAARALGARQIIGVDPNAKFGRPLWTPSDGGMMRDLVRSGWFQSLPEPLRGLAPDAGSAPPAPDMMEVISASIDVMTEAIRRTRQAVDPVDVLLDVDLSQVSVMEFHRAQEAIAAGRHAAEAQIDALCALTGAE